MRSKDISKNLFHIKSDLLEEVVPTYKDELRGAGVDIDYLLIDKIVGDSIGISMNDRAVWYASIEEVAETLYDRGIITALEHENVLLHTLLGVKV